jgi:hypothetical protein
LRPVRAPKLTSQCKRGRLSKTRRLGPGPHTMTTQRGRRQLPTDGRSSRIQSTMRSKRPLLNHRPRRRPRPSRPTAGPARPAPASSATVQPRADDAPSWTRRATTPTRPSEPHDCLPHCHAPRPFRSATAAAGRHGHRTPEAGGRTLDTWTLRHPYRTPDTDQSDSHPWDTGRSHRTPTRTGRRQHRRRPDLLSLLAEGPHAGRPAVFLLSHDQAAAGSLRWPGRASAHCSPQTNFGSSVERAALGQVLWRVQQRSVLWRAERADALNGR